MRCALSMLIFLVGCEPMSDAGGLSAIVSPAEVDSTASNNNTSNSSETSSHENGGDHGGDHGDHGDEHSSTDADGNSGDDLTFKPPTIISSEEIQDQPQDADPGSTAAATDHGGDHGDPTGQLPDGQNLTDGSETPGADAHGNSGAASNDSPAGDGASHTIAAGSFPGTVEGWPLRLVTTLPDTNPPRAVLGLPNGQEIVVTPGKMIPEYQLVVMSIGPNSADLAQISPDGDHAAVRPISLQTQY